MFRALVFIVLLPLLLTGCRYWSLYKFADQFCDFDEYVSVSQQEQSTHIDFLTPVLPQTLLLRYLHAQPVLTTYKIDGTDNTAIALSDTFYIQRSRIRHKQNPENYKIKVYYHLAGDVALLSAGILDERLSALFSPEVVKPVLKSICSNDYDLSLKRLDMRFTLNDIQTQYLPRKNAFISTFGEPDTIDKNTYQYRFDFVQEKEKNKVLQNRPIDFSFSFGKFGGLKNMHILYYKYDYWLDFEHQKGRLIVNRT